MRKKPPADVGMGPPEWLIRNPALPIFLFLSPSPSLVFFCDGRWRGAAALPP